MEFLIADTFTTSLAKLTNDEQKAVKNTAFDLQIDPANPGMQFHKLDRAKDKNFWSVRVSRDIRLIVHKTAASLLLCYVDHHDPAYHWAERRKLETHPTTGAAQLVVIRETVREIEIPQYVEVAAEPTPKPRLFDGQTDERLLSYGVPAEWLNDVRAANEDTLFQLVEHLPAEAGEALLELATGGTPELPLVVGTGEDPFEHPDAQRRFRVVDNTDELAQALDYPWEKWAIFLHPSQRETVERNYNGPAKVGGTAGTGKTVVALHRAVRLARENPNARVLVTTFNRLLAQSLKTKLRHLAGNSPSVLERVEICGIKQLADRLYRSHQGSAQIASDDELRDMVIRHAQDALHSFSDRFVWTEWREVVDAWQLDTWEAYRDFKRLGRKTQLREPQRESMWAIFRNVQEELANTKRVTYAGVFWQLADRFAQNGGPYDFAIVDEAQDLEVAELRFLAALAGGRPNGLFLAGDQGQRIFQSPFSWKSLGVDIRGRSSTLKINYRTSQQIRSRADQLLPPEVADVDGNKEDRRGTISALDGPEPKIVVFDTEQEESEGVQAWIGEQIVAGISPAAIAVIVRSPEQFPRAEKAVEAAGLTPHRIEQEEETIKDAVSILSMHLAKGLEFRCVAVMACDDEIIPLQERIESVTDDSDLEEVYNTERHLLYVACTRARDCLWVSGVAPASEFLDDLKLANS